MSINQYITIRDIKRITALSTSECYRLARRIPGTVKIGRAVRVPLKGFENYWRGLPASSVRNAGINEIMERLATQYPALEIADPGARLPASRSSE